MKCGLLLDVVVWESATIFQLFSGKNETLLIWWNSFLILNLSLDVFDSIRWFDLKGDSFSGQGLDEDLHTSTKTEYKMKGAFLLDVIIGEGTSIFELFSSKDKTLLIWRNSFLVLDLGFDIFNGVGRLNLEGDGFSSESLDEDLHTSSKTKYKMKSALFLDVVVRKSTSIFKLLTSKDETLLIWRNSLLILNLGLHILDGIRWLDLKGDGLSS